MKLIVENSISLSGKMSPGDFLLLTTTGEERDLEEIEARANLLGDWESAKAGKLSLVVEIPSGKVKEHEGRARAFLAKKEEIAFIPVEFSFIDEAGKQQMVDRTDKIHEFPVRHIISQFRSEFDRISRVQIVLDKLGEKDIDPLKLGEGGFISAPVKEIERIIDRAASRWMRKNRDKTLDDYAEEINNLYSFEPNLKVTKKIVRGIYRVYFEEETEGNVAVKTNSKAQSDKIQESVENYFLEVRGASDLDREISRMTLEEWLNPEFPAPWDADYKNWRKNI